MKDLPDVSSARGAPMGRMDFVGDREAVEFDLNRLRWVDGDYDEGGAYWGYVEGTHIYRAVSEEGNEILHVRAKSAEEAMAMVRETYPNAVFSDDTELEMFYEAYLECALTLSENPFYDAEVDNDETENLADSGYELAEETEEIMKHDCRRFLAEARGLLDEAREKHGYAIEQAGVDFWLTRNGHGAGFWDRGLGDLGDELTNVSKEFGEDDLTVGDDKMIYSSTVPVDEVLDILNKSDGGSFQP